MAGLAGRLFGRRAVLPVLWLAALCPFTANYDAAALTETLTLACMSLAFYALARWRDSGMGYNRWLWITAAGLSYGILLRPEQGLVAAAVVPAMLWMALRDRREWMRGGMPVLVGACCVLLPLVPWTIRNWQTFHVFEPLAPRSACDPGEVPAVGFDRWYRTWGMEFASTVQVYWPYDGSTIDINALPPRALTAGDGSNEMAAQTAALIADYNQETAANPGFDARFDALARTRIAAHPMRYYALLPLSRTLDMALRPRTEMIPIAIEWWHWREHRGESEFALAYAALNLACFALGVAGVWRWRRLPPDARTMIQPILWAMAATIALRWALLMTLDNSEPRYTLEFFPVLLVWAGGLFSSPSSDHPATNHPATNHPATNAVISNGA